MTYYPRLYNSNQSSAGIVPVVSEPMTLGSPTTSPQTPGTQYLPGFLLGDHVQLTSHVASSSVVNGSRPMQLSPTHVSPGAGSAARSTLTQPGAFHQTTDRLMKRPTSPPTQSLWSNAQRSTQRGIQPAVMDSHPSSGIRHSTPSGMATGGRSSVAPPTSPLAASLWNQPPRPSTNDTRSSVLTTEQLADVLQSPRHTELERQSEECWVTIFGFPASRASFILSQFGQFGTIEKHIVTNDGNWMHIKYQNKLQARCALGRNGRVFGDNIMVGVTPCADQDVMHDRFKGGAQAVDFDAERENSFTAGWNSPATPRLGRQAAFMRGPLKERMEGQQSVSRLTEKNWLNQSLTSPKVAERPLGTGVARHSSMRALAGDGRLGSQLNRTTSVRHNKESGLLSKALGYMFGWS